MTVRIDPKMFTKIMALPKAVRLDLLEFVSSTAVAPEQLETIIQNLRLPSQRNKGVSEKTA